MDEIKRTVRRRTVIAMSVGAVAEVMLARILTQPAAAATPMATKQLAPKQLAGVRELSQADTVAFVKQQLASNSTAQSFMREFQRQKYQFILERAKGYIIGGQTLAILPSLVPVKRTDPSHRSVGISISSSTGTVAAGALISHNPFRVTEFTIYGLDSGGALLSHAIPVDKLTAAPEAEIVKGLGAASPVKVGISRKATTARQADLEKVVGLFYQQLTVDKYSSPLYPPDGARSMLAQLPLIQKFSVVNGLYHGGGAKGISACTSTSSNWCTSTSCVIEL